SNLSRSAYQYVTRILYFVTQNRVLAVPLTVPCNEQSSVAIQYPYPAPLTLCSQYRLRPPFPEGTQAETDADMGPREKAAFVRVRSGSYSGSVCEAAPALIEPR